MTARAALLGATLLALAGCAPFAVLPEVSDLSDVGSEETVLVGRVELIPPLEPDEQEVGTFYGRFRDKAVLYTDEHMPSGKYFDPRDANAAILAPLDGTFYAKVRRWPQYIVAGSIYMRLKLGAGGSGRPSEARLPGGFKIDIRPGDRAVYVGTIQYHRDEFFGITRIEVVDEYGRTNAEFQRRFGTGVRLRKALLSEAL